MEWIDSKIFEGDVRRWTLSFATPDMVKQDWFEEADNTGQVALRRDRLDSTSLPGRMFVLRTASSPGYFVRVLPGHESYNITWKVKQTNLIPFEGDERVYLKDVARKIQLVVFSSWRSF